MTHSPGTPARTLRGDTSGFVLVGVIMFILVLTILGLSLFSLSGFEAQFFNASLSRQDAYYTATGGIERAKWVLTQTRSLDQVKANLPDGVIYTTAHQGVDYDTGDSTGYVTWTGSPPPPVWIRVLAERHGVQSCVEAQFRPQEPKQIYRQLITSPPGMTIIDYLTDGDGGGSKTAERRPQTWLSGPVWQNSTDTSWSYVPTPQTAHPVSLGGAPSPDSSFVAARWPNVAVPIAAPQAVHNLNVVSSAPVYYGTSSYFENMNNPVTLNVRGTAVWLFQAGVKMKGRIVVQGSSDDRLIIVANRPAGQAWGIWLGTVQSNNVPVFLITNGQAWLKEDWSYTSDSHFPYLSVFANGVQLAGPVPTPTNNAMSLNHDTAIDDALLEPLYNAGVLPNTSPGFNRALVSLPGTWRSIHTGGLN